MTSKKIHLLLGLCSGLILIIIGITGSILSFEQEVLAYLNKQTYKVPISTKEKLPTVKLLKTFETEQKNKKVDKIKFSNIENKSFVIFSHDTQTNKKLTHHINPYNSDILVKEKGISFFRTVESIHRTLLLKDFGKNIVGISVLIFLFLIISGIYLLVIKFKRKLTKMLVFNIKRKGNLLSNIHATLGIWIFPFYLVSILSGLNWSYPLYNDTLYKLLQIKKTPRNMKKETSQVKSSFENVSKAIKMFNDEVPQKYSYSLLSIPRNGSIYKFLYMDESAQHRRERNKLVLDIDSQKILSHDRFEDKPLKEQIMISMLTIHTGEYFGLFGKIVMFIIALLLPILCISGAFKYIKHKS